MKVIKKSYIATISLGLLFACNTASKKQPANLLVTDFKNQLIKQQIGKSDYFISIPDDYKITTRDGPDFSIYYFAPVDKSDKTSLSGGFYFGNFPRRFEPDDSLCKITTIQSKVLDSTRDWVQYNCKEQYEIQTIINIGEYNKIHAFGNIKSKEDIDKALYVFSTLTYKGK